MIRDNINVRVSPHQEKVWKFYNILPTDNVWLNSDIVNIAKEELSLSRATAYRYIRLLINKGLVKQMCRGRYKLIDDEKVIDVRKEVSPKISYGEVGGRKTFVKTRY